MTTTLRVGILVDSLSVLRWHADIIKFIQGDSRFEIRLVVLNEFPVKQFKPRHLIYRFLRKIDRLLFKNGPDNFDFHGHDILKDVEVLRCKPARVKFHDDLQAEAIDAIKNQKLDVIVRFGFRILKGEILSSARFGVWSLHHGDNDVNRGGPPAFWEVVRREPVTGVTLLILSDLLDGGKVLGKSFVKTDFTSFSRNQNAAYRAGIELFCAKLNELALKGGDLEIFSKGTILPSIYSGKLYRDPGNARSLAIATGYLMRLFGTRWKRIFYQQQWHIKYNFNTDPYTGSLYRYKQLTPPPGVDWADPFVMFKNDRYYVFYEEFIHGRNRGHINCIVLDKKTKSIASAPLKVLEENYHLSYPFLIEYKNETYMVPEGAAGNSVILYRCEDFPLRWVRAKVLLSDIALFDPTLLFHEGHWYLFGTQKHGKSSANQYLHIYVSDDLLNGNWLPHPANPVCRDVRNARPAGRIFSVNGKLIRPAQICAPKYGYGIRFMEITKLTPHEFKEEMQSEILPSWSSSLLATHTFNAVEDLTVMDAQNQKRRLL